MSDFGPTAPIANLKLRARMLADVRRFLQENGYWEVETPILSADVTIDAHLDPFVVPLAQPLDGGVDRLYLQTSPEFAMKRLLASGSGSIYQITKAFRKGESGRFHNPEFTIIEWYKVGGTYHELMDEVGQLASKLLEVPQAKKITYRQAFLKYAGIDPFTESDGQLLERCKVHGFGANTRDELLNFLLATEVEPNLGVETPVFLYDFPASQAALSVIDPGPPAVGQRFELYIRGIELCNGYQELLDSAELRRRNRIQNQIKVEQGDSALPEESRLLAAMDAGLPSCAGVAVGFDRLVMLAANASDIRQVLPFPIQRA